MGDFKRFLSSFAASIILMTVYAAGLALATFIEKYHGTAAAKAMVYFSPAFIFLQFLLVANFILVVLRKRYVKRKKWTLITVHSAFAVILLGALVTHLSGEEGKVHIREGQKSDEMLVQSSSTGFRVRKLPFELELSDFRMVCYPGSRSPSSYESDLIIHDGGDKREAKVFMNHTLDVNGYRFFQASYDKDEKGTILSVNHDVAGRSITYAGYFMLLAGFLMSFAMKKTRFRQLTKQLREVRGEMPVAILAALLLLSPSAPAKAQSPTSGTSVFQAVQTHSVPKQHAAAFGSIAIQSNGRIMPINTFSSEILRKLHKRSAIGKLNPDQFLLGVLSMPEMWMHVPFIEVANHEIEALYKFPGSRCAYRDAFDETGNYKLADKLGEIHAKPLAERNRFDNDLIKLDERINIFSQLIHKQLINIFPNPEDPGQRWFAPGDDLSALPRQDSLFAAHTFARYLSAVDAARHNGDWTMARELAGAIKAYQLRHATPESIRLDKIEVEITYNRMDFFNRCKNTYLIAGGLLLVFAAIGLFNRKKRMPVAEKTTKAVIVAIFAMHTAGMAVRWYISGYAPWSNSYETMVYVGWATVLAGLIFGRKSSVTMALATLFGAVILFVAALNWMNPQIGTLIPVLKSPWLMFHVAVIVAAYGFFGTGLLLGVANLSLMAFAPKTRSVSLRIRELSIINNLSLMAGLALMSAGTFLGAIWANESWGRYWGWDPKETWALITIVAYAIATHLHLIWKDDGGWLFNFASVIAFASVWMTFLGVNYLLSGMHSYGQYGDVAKTTPYLCISICMIAILGAASYFGNRNRMKGEGFGIMN